MYSLSFEVGVLRRLGTDDGLWQEHAIFSSIGMSESLDDKEDDFEETFDDEDEAGWNEDAEWSD